MHPLFILLGGLALIVLGYILMIYADHSDARSRIKVHFALSGIGTAAVWYALGGSPLGDLPVVAAITGGLHIFIAIKIMHIRQKRASKAASKESGSNDLTLR